MNYLGECIESQLNMRHSKLVQWFRMVELPRVAGQFIPLFKKWSVEYAGRDHSGYSCCTAVKKLGAVHKLHSLATEAGFEEDFLLHFGTKILPGKNIEEVEFWIGYLKRFTAIDAVTWNAEFSSLSEHQLFMEQFNPTTIRRKSACILTPESTNPAMLDPITLAEVGYKAAESESLHKSVFRKLLSTSYVQDIWMGTRLLFVDILDAIGLLRKQFRHHKVTKRERKKIERTLANIASLVPITILMFLPTVWGPIESVVMLFLLLRTLPLVDKGSVSFMYNH
ncbi:hypothetical protein Acr_16g0008100 [Actinidia rufa]|uniref:LETM1-like protein n=1 Tax=Actinidia rufa TaxID=165716 RepID=A0A7J0FZT0_9ERIC|nr:hypothetical protein Acr_16g0008100 [Actinidia rufa]